MAKKRRWWNKQYADPAEGAVESYRLVKSIHAPTATALLLGTLGGIFLAWKLFASHGWLALLVGVISGAVIGAIVGVVVYWLFRFFAAMGE